MKLKLLLLLLLLPIAHASMDVDISISSNDIVKEDFTLLIDSDSEYDYFDFQTINEPFGVIYDGEYSQEDALIKFEKDLQPGLNEIAFTLLFDDLIEKNQNRRVFRTVFNTEDDIRINLTLPKGYYLSREPSATPSPLKITTDGARITLYWEFEKEASIAVFYEKEKILYTLLLFAFIVVLVLVLLISVYIQKKSIIKKIDDMLSENEKLVLGELKDGEKKQKDIAKKLNFSKSRMSKIIRKLEEKNLIEKTPYFKTNKIKLK